MDPEIRHGDRPKTALEEWAVGNAYAFVHTSINKNMSNAAAVEQHKRSHHSGKDLRTAIMADYDLKGIAEVPRFTLNSHNITQIQREIYETYRWDNKDEDNPYRKLEKSNTWSLMHDGTTVWVRPINTTFLRVVDHDTLAIHRVPFTLRQVPGSFTGEVLCEELIQVISNVKKVKDNAFDQIETILIEASKGDDEPSIEQAYKALRTKIEELAQKKMWGKLSDVSDEVQQMESDHPHLSTLDLSTVGVATSSPASVDIDVPARPPYFKIASVQGVDVHDKVIRLTVEAENTPTLQIGDGCQVNVKGARLVEETIGMPSSFSRCHTHIAHGSTRRGTYISKANKKPWDDADSTPSTQQAARTPTEKAKHALVTLSSNLKSILGHFATSSKSHELLNKALEALEMHDVHQLTWGGTRMCSFLDSCVKCSDIVIPLHDTITTANLRPEQSSYLLSPPGLYTLQLLSDLHKPLVQHYLRQVDKDQDDVLICEVYRIATAAAEEVKTFTTKKADYFISTLHLDEHKNVQASFVIGENQHKITLNKRLTSRNESLEKLKEQLLELKSCIKDFFEENILDQIEEEVIAFLFSAFDLVSTDDLEDRLEKIDSLHAMYGVNREHSVDSKWFDYQVILTYKSRLSCTLAEIRDEFTKAYPAMNLLSGKLRTRNFKTQVEAWQSFYSTNRIAFPNLCHLVEIMFSVAVNTGWVERAYSILEQICPKRRNQLHVSTIRELFLLSVLRLPVKGCFEYGDVIKNAGRKFPMV